VETTYNPIREVDKPRFGPFKRVAPMPGYALVLHREGHPLTVMRKAEERMTLGEATWSNFLKIYWVDLNEHALEIRCQLPADTDAFSFSAFVHLRCAVEDPVRVIELGLTDVREALEPRVVDVMRNTSRRFPVERSAEAEQEVTAALREEVAGADFCPGLSVRSFTVSLDLEETARRHVRELKEAARRHDRDTEEAQREHERAMQQAQLQHVADIQAAARRHAVEMEESKRRHREQMARLGQDQAQAKLQGELEKLKAELEIERSKQYLPLILDGNWSLLSLFLAQHPERLSEVISVMMGQQQVMLDKQIETLHYFLDNDVVEKSDFENRGKQLLTTALEQLSAGIGLPPGSARIDPTKAALAGKASDAKPADAAEPSKKSEPPPQEPAAGADGEGS
jgi:hypothetical protein